MVLSQLSYIPMSGGTYHDARNVSSQGMLKHPGKGSPKFPEFPAIDFRMDPLCLKQADSRLCIEIALGMGNKGASTEGSDTGIKQDRARPKPPSHVFQHPVARSVQVKGNGETRFRLARLTRS